MKNFQFTFRDFIWIKVLEPLIRSSRFFRTGVIYYSFLKRRFRVQPVDIAFLKNKEGIKAYDIDENWFISEKKLGISGVARLKNSADFLEIVVESFLPYLDEIVLVAEVSTDNTNTICELLVRKYPNKIKYFLYEPEVRFRSYVGQEKSTSDSVHSFAYFTNWAFSKTKYKYVMRLDDDILPIPETWETMREYILKNQPNEYILYYGINLLRKGNQYGALKTIPRCGTWGDNGIYPVSKYSYFTQIPGSTEAFHINLIYKVFGLGYLHLKNLKHAFGTVGYSENPIGKYVIQLGENSELDELHKYTEYPPSKIYKLLIDNKIIGTP